ncbi:hypothetical protein [Nocardia sp. NPDC003979]
MSIRWIDGPSNHGMYEYCMHVAGSRGRFDSARYTRILTHHGWQSGVLHEDVPPGSSPPDNEIGWRTALTNLVALAEHGSLTGQQ